MCVELCKQYKWGKAGQVGVLIARGVQVAHEQNKQDFEENKRDRILLQLGPLRAEVCRQERRGCSRRELRRSIGERRRMRGALARCGCSCGSKGSSMEEARTAGSGQGELPDGDAAMGAASSMTPSTLHVSWAPMPRGPLAAALRLFASPLARSTCG